MTTDGAGRNAVKVETEHGKVTLHGTVDSEAVKDKAEATARAVGGVTDVRNLVQVVKESQQKWVKAADTDVKDSAERPLKADKKPFQGIEVKSVDNGVVFLGGDIDEPGSASFGLSRPFTTSLAWRGSPPRSRSRKSSRVRGTLWGFGETRPHGTGFDTGTILPGAASAPITVSTPGTLGYHCVFHPTMVGTLSVAP